MKLDTKNLRYLTADDWRVLTAVEHGSKNHEIVPTSLIVKLAGLRSGGGVHRCISVLAKADLIAQIKNQSYQGYRITYGGYDFLALHTYQKKGTLYSVSNTRVGVGKESDILVVASSTGAQHILKIHRLGRISFRTVKSNRDYLRNRKSGSWLYLSSLAASKEYHFMIALREAGFSVPEPLAQNRHTIVMSLIDGPPLRQISEVPDPAGLYAELMEMILKLARFGLIHGDFNEFNILVKEEKLSDFSNAAEPYCLSDVESHDKSTGDSEAPKNPGTLTPVLIDFPQMVSMDHPNAAMYFDRDVECVKLFFSRRFRFTSDEPGPFFSDARKQIGRDGAVRLDVKVAASGFSKRMAKELEEYMESLGTGAVMDEGMSSDGNDDGDGESETHETPEDSLFAQHETFDTKDIGNYSANQTYGEISTKVQEEDLVDRLHDFAIDNQT